MSSVTDTQGCSLSVSDNQVQVHGGGVWVGESFQELLEKVNETVAIDAIPSDETMHIGYAKKVDGELLIHLTPEVDMKYGRN